MPSIEDWPTYYLRIPKRPTRKQTSRRDLTRGKEYQPRRNLISVVKEIDFLEEDFSKSDLHPSLKPTSIKPLIERFLTLENEIWPEGHGFIVANYDPKFNILEHMIIGRVVDLGDDNSMTFGVVASRQIGSLFYRVMTSSPYLRSLLPQERQSNMILNIPGNILWPYAPPLTTKQA